MRRFSSLLGPALLLLTTASFAQEAPGTRPALAGLGGWLDSAAARGEAEALAKLGPPDRVEVVTAGAIAMTWEEFSWVRVQFRAGKVRRIEGHFTPHVKADQVTLEQMRKLRPGMTRKAVEQILGGPPDEDRDLLKDNRRCEWKRGTEVTVQFATGKAVDADRPAVGVRPALAKEARLWLDAGRGRLSEAEVFARMGRPDFVFNPADPDTGSSDAGDIGMIWREQSRIEIDLSDGKAQKLRGQFAPHARSTLITLDNFRKLQSAMKEGRLEEVLGPADDETRPEPGIRRLVWLARQEMTVYFRAGKVQGVSWWGPF